MDYLVIKNIETQLWYNIVDKLKEEKWLLIKEYNHFDKGIDYDEYKFKKGIESISLTWDNWFEGTITCKKERFEKLILEFENLNKDSNTETFSLSLFDKIKNLFKRK